MALPVMNAGLVELFQWLRPEEATALVDTSEGRGAIEDELAEVMMYLLRIADVLEADVAAATAASNGAR